MKAHSGPTSAVCRTVCRTCPTASTAAHDAPECRSCERSACMSVACVSHVYHLHPSGLRIMCATGPGPRPYNYPHIMCAGKEEATNRQTQQTPSVSINNNRAHPTLDTHTHTSSVSPQPLHPQQSRRHTAHIAVAPSASDHSALLPNRTQHPGVATDVWTGLYNCQPYVQLWYCNKEQQHGIRSPCVPA